MEQDSIIIYLPTVIKTSISRMEGKCLKKKWDIDNHSAETRLSSDSDEIVKNILIHNGSISECSSADE